MKYFAPTFEIEKIESVDVVCASTTLEDNETEILSLRKDNGTIAGGSTVSNIAGRSGASNAFSAGDIFGLR